jgi:hypothetical protein
MVLCRDVTKAENVNAGIPLKTAKNPTLTIKEEATKFLRKYAD